MADYEYLVTCGGHKKVIQVQSKSDVIGEIRKRFKVDINAAVNLAIFNDKWGEYVDLEEDCDLPTTGKIEVTLVYSNTER